MSMDVPFHRLTKEKTDLCIYLFLDFSVAIIIVRHHVKSVYNDYASGLAFLEEKKTTTMNSIKGAKLN